MALVLDNCLLCVTLPKLAIKVVRSEVPHTT